ncbi:MAG: hypothetical protein CVU89_12210 [Firmicutes bacterium HGW-Firmicutes-14]|nr:MAG: hypothetical protein CVU89_12210 [Firmicutes bacterium HGW-Firmicutes-14]
MKKLVTLILSLMIFLLVSFLCLKLFSGLYINYSWFKDLGYSQLFITPVLSKIKIQVLAFFIYFLIAFLMSLIVYKVFTKIQREEIRVKSKFHLYVIGKVTAQEKDVTPVSKKRIIAILAAVSLILSVFFAATAGNGWMNLLEFNHSTDFGLTDQVFNKDISFYVFKLPFYNFLLKSLLVYITGILLLSLFLFPLTGSFSGNILKKGSFQVPEGVRRFWSILTGILFILFGIKKYLSMYAVMYAQTGYVYGAGYTDIHITVPLAKVMAVLAILCGIASLLYFIINDHRLVIGAVIIYVIVAISGSFVHSVIQYNVSNNEFVKEKPYIEQEIKFTRMAYNLDKIKVKDYPGTTEITMDDIEDNRSTMDNIRLNDPKPLQTVLSQNQGLRYYYRFNDIDIDRYNIDGEKRQVLLSAREMSDQALTEKAGTFVNLTMKYTHGYGAVVTLANEIDNSGYARLVLKDIPPKSLVEGINIREPRIYYGELTNDTKYEYVVGNTLAKEFDYPLGDDNAENTYQGKTGLSVKGLNRLFLSAHFETLRLFFAREIDENSKLLVNRNILNRARTLFPYLRYDRDPYMVIAKDGKLYWIIDAYTHTDKFPYSTPVGDLNYIRNSVKVVVDAYHGTVDYYIFDKNDPILKTYLKIFPGVFKDSSKLPSNLADHVRYPEDYFNIQSTVLLNYHVSNPQVFYNREDTWEIAKKVDEDGTKNIEPYYSTMRLPGEKDPEFTLIRPFTPASRQEQHRNNLVAWLSACSDGEKYGELILYKVPKNVEIQGPLMIDSLIDQDTTISSKLTLWSQGGSQVIRGNLLAVPINGGFIYVEPIYIRAEQQGASIPQMQAIVFAIDKKIVMVETKNLDVAVAEFFAKEGAPETQHGGPQKPGTGATGQPDEPGGPITITPKESVLQKIEQLKQQLEELQKEVESM